MVLVATGNGRMKNDLKENRSFKVKFQDKAIRSEEEPDVTAPPAMGTGNSHVSYLIWDLVVYRAVLYLLSYLACCHCPGQGGSLFSPTVQMRKVR